MIAGCIMAASSLRPLKMDSTLVNVRILSFIAELSVVSLYATTGARSPRAHAARIPATVTIKDFAQTCRALYYNSASVIFPAVTFIYFNKLR